MDVAKVKPQPSAAAEQREKVAEALKGHTFAGKELLNVEVLADPLEGGKSLLRQINLGTEDYDLKIVPKKGGATITVKTATGSGLPYFAATYIFEGTEFSRFLICSDPERADKLKLELRRLLDALSEKGVTSGNP